jgi:glycosyltransferase involved in cell wall biosynthesis
VRTLFFLVPGTGGRFACGGLWAELKAFELARQVCLAEVVTYRQREANTLFLEDMLRSPQPFQGIFVISWGFDVSKLICRLQNYPVLYHAHSTGYGFSVPPQIPIVTVSRNSLGYWGQKSPNSLIYYLPNQISDEFNNRGGDRDIDVLVQARKSSQYLLQKLIPALKSHCQVQLIDAYVEDLAALFNRAKVYLYDSAEYWAQQRVSEGFGLQPMEAMACGCQVFSSVNGGLADYLDPGFNCQKIAGYATAYDVQRILKSLAKYPQFTLPESMLAEYRSDNIRQRWRVILEEINEFFDCLPQIKGDIPSLTRSRLLTLQTQRYWQKLQQKLKRGKKR